jgi:hypothetical protein
VGIIVIKNFNTYKMLSNCYSCGCYEHITITVQTGLSFQANDFVQLHDGNESYIWGEVVSYNSNTGEIVISPCEFCGNTGSITGWKISLSGVPGISGTSGTSGTSAIDGTSGSSGTSGISSSSGTSGSSGVSISIDTPANGLSLDPLTNKLSISLASSGVTGALSGTDFNSFSEKVSYDKADNKDETKKLQARTNIDVYSKLQIDTVTGDLNNLNTVDKSNLVIGINQANAWKVIEW